MGLFHTAVKAESKLRLAISGPSGSGKTYTSLAIASALANGKSIALIDTEHGSASKYADLYQFDVAEMHAPFHPDKFIAALREAESAGYAVVILDSISHAWSGTGGVRDIVDEAAKRSKSGNTYMAWKEGTPVQNKLIDAIVQSGIHVIATMRSKTDYILVDNGNGRQAPKKVGMAPVQRDQFEYEFDVVLDMDVENNGIVTKSRCPALTGKVFAKPGRDVAGILSVWLTGEKPTTPQPQPAPQPATEAPKPPNGNGNSHAPEPTSAQMFDAIPNADAERAALAIKARIVGNTRPDEPKAHPEILGKLQGGLHVALPNEAERHALETFIFGSDDPATWTQGQAMAVRTWLSIGKAGDGYAPSQKFLDEWKIIKAAIMPTAEVAGK